MVMLNSARRQMPVPALARWLPGLGIAATLSANVAHGLGHGPLGAAVAAWPAVALAGSYELFMAVIRGARQPGDRVSEAGRVPGAVSGADPLRVRAAEVSAAGVAAGRLPWGRAIRGCRDLAGRDSFGCRYSGSSLSRSPLGWWRGATTWKSRRSRAATSCRSNRSASAITQASTTWSRSDE